MPKLTALLFRLKLLFFINFLAFVVLLVPKLKIADNYIKLDEEILFYINLFAFTVLFLVLFLFYFYSRKLKRRLEYVEKLGVDRL